MSFLSGLPVYDESRFSATNGEGGSSRQVLITAPVYTPTSSASLPPTDQIIVTEKSNILLKHLERLAQQKASAEAAKVAVGSKRPAPSSSTTSMPAATTTTTTTTTTTAAGSTSKSATAKRAAEAVSEPPKAKHQRL